VALLTAEERASLARFNIVNGVINLGQRLTDASTLQCYGDSATSHARLVTQPQAGDTVRVEAHGAMNRLGVWDVGCDVTLEFTMTGAVTTPGNIPVLLGASLAQTAQALALVITRSTVQAVVAEAHAIDLGVVDITHNTPGAALLLSSPAPASRIVLQNNQEGLPLDCYVMIIRKRTITAEDVQRGRIRFDTGWTKIVEGFASLYASSSDQSPNNYTGQISYTGGVLELSQGTGSGQFLSGNVMHLYLLGVQ
jgi:hypothetical protein